MRSLSNRWLCATLATGIFAVGASAAQAQTLIIEDVTNSAAQSLALPLSAQEIEDAVPLPEEEVTPQELEQMRERFRQLNPDTLDTEQKRSDVEPDTFGVPEKVAAPAANSPYWSTGRLLFRKSDGKTYRCSAQYVSDLKVILTAAHCLYDRSAGAFNTDFVFQRAYNEGATAQTVGWRCASVYAQYHSPSVNYAYDYGFLLADKNDERAPLELQTGAPANTALAAIGYPQNFGAGQALYKVDGRWASVSGGIVTMSGNPMRSGNSGGAWFTEFAVDGGSGTNLVVSLNSHHITGNTTDENGPLFTSDTTRLMEHVRDGGCLN
ncbi:trypsin-like serine peptidase [Roseibium sediminicola]|uniref:Serine protease n=1 Tax=Roseibium sediminicola TaxID=2933272 RepID=A0ABT0GQF1_9HYPH|nr:serine protease [Roseibium sp. CAU 1639]MCK7611648.1 serine protease [Roseibium sp. CAU 1639]